MNNSNEPMNNSNEVKEIWHVNDRLIFSDKRGKAVAEAIVDYSKEDGIFRAQDNAKLICKAVNEYDKLKEDNAALLDALKPFINLADEVFKEGRYERNGILYAFNKAEITFEALRAAKEAGQKAESK